MLINLPNSRVPGLRSSKVVFYRPIYMYFIKKMCKPKIRLNRLAILFTCFRYRNFDEK